MNPEGKGVAVMAYTIIDIAELVRYHLVLSEPDNDGPTPTSPSSSRWRAARCWRDASWVFCDRCGCSVDTELIHPDGHHYADDGDFFCADCWVVNEGT
jgi:hypothetical protein